MGRYATLASQDNAQEIQVWHTRNNHLSGRLGDLSAYNHIMTAPNIESSTREERLDYVLNEWRCLHNCEPMEQREQKTNLFGLCRVVTEEDEVKYAANAMFLKAEAKKILYADYIDGKRSYMDITLEIRGNK